MAIDLAPYSILTACVAPGWIDTDINAEYMSRLPESERRRLNPLGRLGAPHEIADVVALLCDLRCTFVTGATIAVDGGQLGSSFKDI
jgi:NAD(P)-dependent dehydrogenase (short-subunit alcohol dehydrogenase family)